MADEVKNLGGRPCKVIDQKIFENLCKIQCTEKEIASVLGVCFDTLEDWVMRTYNERYSTIYKSFADEGKASLRRMMWRHAEKSASMCMFMAKNLLGYKDSGYESDSVEESCKMIADALLKCAGGGNDNTNRKAKDSN